jgi:amino acid permease
MFVDTLDEPLSSRHVGVDGRGECEFVVLAVKVIKMVLFNISWVPRR